MGLEFIDRTLKTSGVVLLVFFPFGLFYLGVFPALAAFSGGIGLMLYPEPHSKPATRVNVGMISRCQW